MAKATDKNFEIEAFLSDLTGEHRPTTIAGDKCVMCQRDAVDFRDELSRKEYTISGMCQICQDDFFGEDE
jgi:hypothetical protein